MSGVRIGGYIIYPAAFILLFVSIFLLIFLIALIKGVGEKNKLKKIKGIKGCQRNLLYKIFSDREDSLNDEEYNSCARILAYIKKHKYWDLNKMLEIDASGINLLNNIIFDEIDKLVIDEDYKKIPPIVCLLDCLNGSCHRENNPKEWMIEEIKEYPESNPDSNIKRVKSFWLDAFNEVSSLYEKGQEYICLYDDENSFMEDLSYTDLESAYDDFASTIGFDVKKETSNVLTKILYYQIKFDLDYNERRLSDFRICKFRSLACAILRKEYNAIFENIF